MIFLYPRGHDDNGMICSKTRKLYVSHCIIFLTLLLQVNKSEIVETDENISTNSQLLNYTDRDAPHVHKQGRTRTIPSGKNNGNVNNNNNKIDDNLNNKLHDKRSEKTLVLSETKSRGTERSEGQPHVGELFTVKEGKAEVLGRREWGRRDVESAGRKLETAGNYLKTVMENGRDDARPPDIGHREGEKLSARPLHVDGIRREDVLQMEGMRNPEVGDSARSHGGVILSLGEGVGIGNGGGGHRDDNLLLSGTDGGGSESGGLMNGHSVRESSGESVNVIVDKGGYIDDKRPRTTFSTPIVGGNENCEKCDDLGLSSDVTSGKDGAGDDGSDIKDDGEVINNANQIPHIVHYDERDGNDIDGVMFSADDSTTNDKGRAESEFPDVQQTSGKRKTTLERIIKAKADSHSGHNPLKTSDVLMGSEEKVQQPDHTTIGKGHDRQDQRQDSYTNSHEDGGQKPQFVERENVSGSADRSGDPREDDNGIDDYGNEISQEPGRSRHRVPREALNRYSEIANNKNIRARKEGDFIIGALFPLHQAPTQKTAYSRQCGEIREYYGIQRVEVFLMTLAAINDNEDLLRNITLGWDIRDSCWYSAIALENSIDFIKDAIAGQSQGSPLAVDDYDFVNQFDATNSTLDQNSARSQSGDDDDNDDDDKNDNSSQNSSSAHTHLYPTASSNSSDGQKVTNSSKNGAVAKCKSETRMKPIVGLVGPGSSEATIQVQNLLQIFNIPQIGYSATSMDLSDKSHYKYFLRVVPPDRHQAQALVDVVVKFGWTYISTVHSDGNYGVRGMEKFVDLAREKGVCIATADNVASSAEDEAFDKVVDNLMKVPNATVVVCFCEGMTVKKLLHAIQRRALDGRFLIVGSDGWGNRLDVVKGHEMAALGALSIKLYSPAVPDFLAHYSKLRPDQPTKNPWFRMFWQQKFKCSLDPQRRDMRGFNKFCTGNESLLGSDQDSKLGFVVKAVMTMATALHAMHQDMCPGVEGLCPAMDPIKGSVYLNYLLNVSFTSYSDEMVHFDSSGDPPGRYEILNYQKIIAADGNVSYDYVTIGHWMTGTLKLNGRPVHLPRLYDRQVKSVCSEPCSWGQAKKVKGVSCCWICTTCLDSEILIENNTDCRPCDLGHWPNANKTDCEQIVIDFISWHNTEAIVCVTVGFIGILCTLWVAAIFVRFHETPVVKASTRELSYIILAGIALAFSANFFIVAKPEQGFCYLTRIFPGLSFSLIYGALVTKTNRIARILEGSKRISTKKPRFMSATAQVVITVIIIGIECAVIISMLIYQPANSKFDYPSPKRVRLVCDTSTLGIIVPLGFDLVLILLCTIYAVKTRNLPENFNEAKFIGFTMYATCIIWSGFFPIYFAGENKEVTLSFSVSLSAAIALLLLFVPKVYVIVWVPEKNTRGAFTTSRDVRCHIGSKSLASGDSIDIKESSTFENLFKSDRGNNKQWKQKSLDEKRLRFVMQRASRSDSTSSYVNHGVIRKHALLGSSGTIIKEPSRDSARTDSTHISGISSCSEKDKIYPGGDPVRQFLTSEFRQSRKLSNVRPDSPAEKEKHRIHNVESLPDYCLVGEGVAGGGITVPTSHQMPRSSQFRKSLSSNCVSMDYKTRSIQCQTSDDLLQCLLPALRRRCLPKGKHILERSTAVDASGHESDSSVANSSAFQCKSSSPSHPHVECISGHPGSTCHCHHDLSDLSPLVYENHKPSKYKKHPNPKDNASVQSGQHLHIRNSLDSLSPHCSHSHSDNVNNSPCNHSRVDYIQRPAEPSPKLSPLGLRGSAATTTTTPSPERKLIPTPTTPDCNNICSTVTKYHHDNSTNHFKVVRNSDVHSGPHHPHHHRQHRPCCHCHHHQDPCTHFPSNTSVACSCNTQCSPRITSSARHMTNSSSSDVSDKLLDDNGSLQESLDIPLSPSPYQHLDSNSDSQTTLSTASSSFTLPPFNTSTDSNRSNQSLFSDTTGSVHNILGDQRTSNRNIHDDNNDDNFDDDDNEVDEFTPLKEHCDDDDDDNDDEEDKKYPSGTAPLSSNMADGGDVIEFQNYLQSRGINLEFSSEKCSEL